jgi:hypothetical protein
MNMCLDEGEPGDGDFSSSHVSFFDCMKFCD